MKKLISLFLCCSIIVFTLCLYPFNAGAADVITSGDYKYQVAKNGNIDIVEYIGNNENVVIPSSIDGKTVENILGFGGNENIKSVEVSEGIKTICNETFKDCPNLADIKLCKSLTFISAYMLKGTAYYNNVDNWDGNILYADGWLAFIKTENENVKSEIELNVKDGTEKIPAWLNNIIICTKISIPASTVLFPYKELCIANKKLTEITVDKNNTKFASENGVLYNKAKTKLICYPCEKKDEVYKTPATLKKINSNAFSYNKYLKRIGITKNVTSVPRNTFDLCLGLNAIKVSKANTNYAASKGVLFNKTKTKLIHFPASYSKKTYTIPKTVKKVCNGAFIFSNLKKVTFTKNVKTVDSRAFYGCFKLKNITIHKTVKKIGDFAFGWGYKYYEEYELPWDTYELIKGISFRFSKNSAAAKYYKRYMSDEDYKGAWSYKYIK